jgi:hypothetical protein
LVPASVWNQSERRSEVSPDSTAIQACIPLSDPAEIPGPSVIDFDDLIDGQTIGSTYQVEFGVTFEDSRDAHAIIYGGEPGLAQSPPNVARNEAVPPATNDNLPLNVYFDSAKTHVGFWIGNGQGTSPTATLRAYDADDAEICSIAIGTVPDDHLSVFVGVHDTAGSIIHISLEYEATLLEESIDDLYFSSDPGSATPTPSPTATATPTPTATWTPSATPTRTPTPLPPTDLIIDGIEFTQSIQDLNNSLPLIAGKRTFVRVYAHSTSGSHFTFATLRLQAGNASTTLYPIAPGGPFVKVRPASLRLLGTHAFLFEIPTFWTLLFNQVTVTAEVNPIVSWKPRSPQETSYNNNSLSQTISFESVPTLHLVIASQPYQIGGLTYSPSFLDQFGLFDWLKRAYPLAYIKLYLRTLPQLQGLHIWNSQTNDFDLVNPTCYILNTYLAYQRAAIIGHPFFPDDTAFYGLVEDAGVGFMRGCSPIGGKWLNGNTRVRVASGPTGSKTWGWDFDGTYGDWYGGHELGHAFTQFHTQGSCGEDKTVKHYPFGYISPVLDLFSPQAIYGFDSARLSTGKNPIYSPAWTDVMTYCDFNWIDSITYQQLKLNFQTDLPRAAPSGQSLSPPQELLTVFGVMDTLSGEVNLPPGFVVYDNPAPDVSSSHAIVLRDGLGIELVRHPFSFIENEPGPAPSDLPTPPLKYIAELVPYTAAATRLEIEGLGGAILHTIEAGVGQPVVQVTAPNGGEIQAGEAITVTWTASDPDGDLLAFNVEYSPDEGLTWEPVALNLTTTQAVVNQFNLVAGDRAQIRVSASDGLHMGQDTSDAPFTILNHEPLVEITSPEVDTTIAVSQTLALEAIAYDIDLGSLEAANLAWASSLDGPLGNGDQLSISELSAGVHLITITADDGQGGVATDSVTVTVVATPLDLPSLPDGLDVGPDLVLLAPYLGVSSSPLFVENQNEASEITWSVTADQPWLLVSEAAGNTPAELTLSVDTANLAPGVYSGNLTFTSPEVPGQSISVVVSFTLPQFEIVLPVVVR